MVGLRPNPTWTEKEQQQEQMGTYLLPRGISESLRVADTEERERERVDHAHLFTVSFTQ